MEQVWRIDIDGSNPRQLSAERNGVGTVCLSPDSHWAIYGTVGDVLRKVSIDGGTPTKLTDKVEHYPEVSPDGRLLAYISVDDQRKHPKITIAAFDNGTPISVDVLVGADGATHCGAFDLAYLCTLPNFTVMAAADEAELRVVHGAAGEEPEGELLEGPAVAQMLEWFNDQLAD